MKITPFLVGVLNLFVFGSLLAAPIPMQARINPVGLGPDALSINLSAPDYQIETDAQGFQHIHMDGFGDDLTPGHFLLPVQNVKYSLPPDVLPGSLELVVGQAQTETLPGDFHFVIAQELKSSCGQAENTCAVTAVQSADQSWVVTGISAPLARISGQGQMRKWQIVDLEFAPFQFDPATGRLTLVRQVSVQLRYRRDPARLDPLLMQDRAMDEQASDLLSNGAAAADWYQAAADLTAPNLRQAAKAPGGACPALPCDYVIITTNEIVNNALNLDAFILNKQKFGHSVWVVTESTYDAYIGQAPNTRADRIRAFLQTNYLAYGIKYVLLIGDPRPIDPSLTQQIIGDVPMKLTYPRLHASTKKEWPDAPTDMYYSDLSGNWDLNGDQLYSVWPEDLQAGGVDIYPEVLVGRIPSYLTIPNRYVDLDKILLKMINYENRINFGGYNSWRETNVLLPMSFSEPGYDGAPLGEELKALLPNYGFTNFYTMYQQGSGVCKTDSLHASSEELHGTTAVRDRWVNNPYGLVVWWGHGSKWDAAIGYRDNFANMGYGKDCWDGTILHVDDTWGLNDNYPAFVFMISCNNGTPEATMNLGYMALYNGAVATVSASRVSWYNADQYDNFANGATAASLAYHYAVSLARSFSAGQALASARIGNQPAPTMGQFANRLVFNLYGDPAMHLVNGTSPLNTPPGSPGAPILTQSALKKLWDVSWNKFTGGEAGFMFQRRTTFGSWVTTNYFPAGTVKGRTLKPNFCGESVFYRLVAYNKWGETIGAEVSSDALPCQPINAAASIMSGGVEISWQTGTGSVDGYRVSRHRIADGSSVDWSQISSDLPKTQLSYTDTNAACGTSYEYRVQAFNATGDSGFSNQPTVTTNPCLPDPPSNIQLGYSNPTQLFITWDDNSSNETSFVLYRATSPAGPWTKLVVLPANTVYSWDLGPLECGSGYYYKVEAWLSKYGKTTSPISNMFSTSACAKPLAPTNLAASTSLTDPTHVYLTWQDQSSNETGFQILRYGPIWTFLGNVGPNTTSFRDPGACSTQPRRYRVRAYNGTTYSDDSNEVTFSIPSCSLYSLAVTATPVLGSKVHLAWQNPEPATIEYYQIYYSSNPDALNPWVLLQDQIPVATLTYDHGSLPCEKGAAYLIKAIGHNVSGEPVEVTSELSAATPMPCAPEIDILPPRPTTLDLYWVNPSGVATGFVIEKSIPGAAPRWEQVATLPVADNLFRVGNLTCGSDYNLRIRSYVGEGLSRLYSDDATLFNLSTLACPASAPPALALGRETQTSVGLSWSAASSTVSGYRIWREAGDAFVEVGATAPDVLNYTDGSLGCGKDATYYVTAENNSGGSLASNLISGGTIPCAPTIRGATWAGVDRASVSWVDTSSNEVSFTVQTSSGPTFAGSETVNSVLTAADSTSLGVPAAGCGVAHYFRVLASNDQGASPASDSVTLTLPCQPAAPVSLDARIVGYSNVMLAWQYSGTGISGFDIWASSDGSSDWHTVGRTGPAARSLLVSNLFPGRRVYFKVQAYQDGGPASESAAVTADLPSLTFIPALMR